MTGGPALRGTVLSGRVALDVNVGGQWVPLSGGLWETAEDRRLRLARELLDCLPAETVYDEQDFGRDLAVTQRATARICPGCYSWSIEYRTTTFTASTAHTVLAAEAVEEHRAECPALDMLLALRLPVGFGLTGQEA